jgi:hypothetical protein
LNILPSLPEALRRFIYFDGLVWVLSHTAKPEDVPLFIANRPVMLLLPAFTPFTTTAMLPERPKDPLTFKINPLVPYLADQFIQRAQGFHRQTHWGMPKKKTTVIGLSMSSEVLGAILGVLEVLFKDNKKKAN